MLASHTPRPCALSNSCALHSYSQTSTSACLQISDFRRRSCLFTQTRFLRLPEHGNCIVQQHVSNENLLLIGSELLCVLLLVFYFGTRKYLRKSYLNEVIDITTTVLSLLLDKIGFARYEHCATNRTTKFDLQLVTYFICRSRIQPLSANVQ